jgi:hypothetical protein
VFFVRETTSKLKTHDLVDHVIYRCRKHRHARTGAGLVGTDTPLAPMARSDVWSPDCSMFFSLNSKLVVSIQKLVIFYR